MTSKRNQLIELLELDYIPAENINDAVIAAKVLPGKTDWRHFINNSLACFGGLALGFSVMFFIAYNWTDLGHIAKFAMVEALIVLAITAYWKMDKQGVTAKVALLVASIFLGVLLALYGQTYQTGADPWQLFFNWALLMFPWALIGRFAAIWILWVGLLNLSIVLYYMAFQSALWMLFESQVGMLWLLFLFNTFVLASWELLSTKWLWLAEQWATRLMAIISGATISWLCLDAIYSETNLWTGLVWLIWLAAVYLVYRIFKPDLFMLAGGALSVIVVVINFVSKLLLDYMDIGGLLFMALLVIGMGTGTAIWLRNIQREWQ